MSTRKLLIVTGIQELNRKGYQPVGTAFTDRLRKTYPKKVAIRIDASKSSWGRTSRMTNED